MGGNGKETLFSMFGNAARNVSEKVQQAAEEARDYAAGNETLQEILTKGSKAVEDLTAEVAERSAQLSEYAFTHSEPLRRLAEIKAIHDGWRRAVAAQDKNVRLYQKLLARELEENCRLTTVFNEVLLANYLAVSEFLMVPAEEKDFRPVEPLLHRLTAPDSSVPAKCALAKRADSYAAVSAPGMAGAFGLMTSLAAAGEAAELSSSAGLAYREAVLGATGCSPAGSTVVLGSLAAVPALAGNYYLADHYSESKYADAQQLKRDTLAAGEIAAGFYSQCDRTLALLRRLNSCLSLFPRFLDGLLSVSFAADSMAEREEFFAVLRETAEALLAVASVSPLTADGAADEGADEALLKAEKRFRQAQQAYFRLKLHLSEGWQALLSELEERSQLAAGAAEREADIAALEEKIEAGRNGAEARINMLRASLQQAPGEAVSAELESQKRAAMKEHTFREEQLREAIDRQKEELHRGESAFAIEKTNTAGQGREERCEALYAALKKKSEKVYLGERAAYRTRLGELGRRFWRFGGDELEALALGEYLFSFNKEERLDFSAAAVVYGKAVGNVLKQILRKRSLPLPAEAAGADINLGLVCRFPDHFGEYLGEEFMQRLVRVTEIRDEAMVGGSRISLPQLDEMHRLLFDARLHGDGSVLDFLNEELALTE